VLRSLAHEAMVMIGVSHVERVGTIAHASETKGVRLHVVSVAGAPSVNLPGPTRAMRSGVSAWDARRSSSSSRGSLSARNRSHGRPGPRQPPGTAQPSAQASQSPIAPRTPPRPVRERPPRGLGAAGPRPDSGASDSQRSSNAGCATEGERVASCMRPEAEGEQTVAELRPSSTSSRSTRARPTGRRRASQRRPARGCSRPSPIRSASAW